MSNIEQLAEKDKQIEEIVERAMETAYGYGGCPVPKCSKNSHCNIECKDLRRWLKTGNKEEVM